MDGFGEKMALLHPAPFLAKTVQKRAESLGFWRFLAVLKRGFFRLFGGNFRQNRLKAILAAFPIFGQKAENGGDLGHFQVKIDLRSILAAAGG